MKEKIKVKHIGEITVLDPDENSEVQLTIYKMSNGAIVGIDSSFLSNTDEPVFSPYDRLRVEVDVEGSEEGWHHDEAKFGYLLYSSKEEFKERKYYSEQLGFNSAAEAKKEAMFIAKNDDIIKVQSDSREFIEVYNKQGKPIIDF